MSLTIIKGTILSAPALGQLEAVPGGYLVAVDGAIQGVYPVLPEQYAGAPVEDFGDALILQSFTRPSIPCWAWAWTCPCWTG